MAGSMTGLAAKSASCSPRVEALIADGVSPPLHSAPPVSTPMSGDWPARPEADESVARLRGQAETAAGTLGLARPSPRAQASK